MAGERQPVKRCAWCHALAYGPRNEHGRLDVEHGNECPSSAWLLGPLEPRPVPLMAPDGRSMA